MCASLDGCVASSLVVKTVRGAEVGLRVNLGIFPEGRFTPVLYVPFSAHHASCCLLGMLVNNLGQIVPASTVPRLRT
jgi:hypothetical protein